jgi:hypothetical protein
MHAISEAIFDIMAREKHDFIDVLKVDVEGGEWSVFNTLFHEQRVKEFPVGQLLIELHYSNMQDVTTLFTALESWNLHPFSREVSVGVVMESYGEMCGCDCHAVLFFICIYVT